MNSTIGNKTNRGFTITGTLLNVALGGLVVAGAGSLTVSHSREVAAMASYPILSSQGHNASSLIAQDIRSAGSVETATSEQLVLKTQLAGHVTTVSYTFDPAQHTLTRSDEHGSQTILTDVDGFSFSLFQRPGIGAAYNTFAPATAANAKLVGCRWSCSRKVAGSKVDSDAVELAPVVLRNRC